VKEKFGGTSKEMKKVSRGSVNRQHLITKQVLRKKEKKIVWEKGKGDGEMVGCVGKNEVRG